MNICMFCSVLFCQSAKGHSIRCEPHTISNIQASINLANDAKTTCHDQNT